MFGGTLTNNPFESTRKLIAESNLPKIPGNTFSEELIQGNYSKRQLLRPGDVKDGGPSARSPVQMRMPGTVRSPLSGSSPSKSVRDVTLPVVSPSRASATSSGAAVPDSSTAAAPSLTNAVLRFYGFFREAVYESAIEVSRIRTVTLNYHLEDNTITIIEKRVDNSGIPNQGLLVKRHAIPSSSGEPLRPSDLAVGGDVTIYGRTYRLTDVDPFTRSFYETNGVTLAPAEEIPKDAHADYRKLFGGAALRRQTGDRELSRQLEVAVVGRSTRLTPQTVAASKQFYEFDRHVLRFFAVWDDRNSLYGDFRMFVINYFLGDDTMAIVETNPPNSGREGFPCFAGRRKVERNGIPECAGAAFASQKREYFTDADLRVGQTYVMYGRPFLIFDCDESTRRYIKEKYGDDSTPVNITVEGPVKPEFVPPEHMGFGDEEDALSAWRSLVPKGPRRRAPTHGDRDILKFSLKMISDVAVNELRQFLLLFWLADDTVSIYESTVPNTGILGGKFLQRGVVKKPDGTRFQATDFAIGYEINVNGHRFNIVSADEHTVASMEAEPEKYLVANVDAVVDKLRAQLLTKQVTLSQLVVAAGADVSTQNVSYQTFSQIMAALESELCDHEVLTLMRFFDRNNDGVISWGELASRVDDVELSSVPVGDTWKETLHAMQSSGQAGSDATVAQRRAAVDYVNECADRAGKIMFDAYHKARLHFKDCFRRAADNSADGLIGEQEFRVTCELLKVPLVENDFRALAFCLFPKHNRRIPVVELGRSLEGTSNIVNFPNVSKVLVKSNVPLTLGPAHGGVR